MHVFILAHSRQIGVVNSKTFFVNFTFKYFIVSEPQPCFVLKYEMKTLCNQIKDMKLCQTIKFVVLVKYEKS